jgi:hypothetical protein
MAGIGTPLAGLGLDLAGPTSGGTPGHMSIPTPLLGAASAAMLPSLSGFSGLDVPMSGLRKRNEDEERRLKLRKVLQTIGKAKSRVSEESIARVSRRLGLQNDIDAEKLSADEKERKVGNRTIGIAGKSILIDIELKNHVAGNVAVMFSGEGKTLEEEGTAAGRILREDLAPKDGVLLQTPLDSFASHLSHVARLDRLSDGVNCFEAMSGLYSSLRRLYDAETTATRDALPAQGLHPSAAFSDDERTESEVARKRSGRPTMHERGKIGLAIEYWAAPLRASHIIQDPSAMDTDDKRSGDDSANAKAGVHALRIDIASSSTSLCPPIRISDGWLPEVFTIPPADSLQGLPWQEPPPTYTSKADAGLEVDSMAIESESKLPDLHFTARLDPPIIVPMSTANNIFALLGVTNSSFGFTSYQAMLLNSPTEEGVVPEISAMRTVTTMREGQVVDEAHRYTLNVHKSDYGCRLEELPFSHPRQLIELLPTLRQWSYFGSLLRGAFASNTSASSKSSNLATPDSAVTIAKLSLEDASKSFVKHEEQATVFSVDIEMTTSPQPSLCLTFIDRESRKLRSIDVQVSPNAEVVIVPSTHAEDPLTTATAKEEAEGQDTTKKARALEICGDVCVWLEWLQRKEVNPT